MNPGAVLADELRAGDRILLTVQSISHGPCTSLLRVQTPDGSFTSFVVPRDHAVAVFAEADR